MITEQPHSRTQQRGATLVVGLIMLVLITLLVVSAFTLSSTNLQAVGNVQFRDESIAAANRAIEQVISSAFADAPTAEDINVDIDNNGNVDYVVRIAAPTCIRTTKLAGGGTGTASSVTLGIAAAPNNYNALWEIDATVSDARSGASVRIHQGIMVLLNQTQYDAHCT